MLSSHLSETAPDADATPSSTRGDLVVRRRLRRAGTGMFGAGALPLSACAGDDPKARATPGPDQSSSPETPPEGSEAQQQEEGSSTLNRGMVPKVPEYFQVAPIDHSSSLPRVVTASSRCE